MGAQTQTHTQSVNVQGLHRSSYGSIKKGTCRVTWVNEQPRWKACSQMTNTPLWHSAYLPLMLSVTQGHVFSWTAFSQFNPKLRHPHIRIIQQIIKRLGMKNSYKRGQMNLRNTVRRSLQEPNRSSRRRMHLVLQKTSTVQTNVLWFLF